MKPKKDFILPILKSCWLRFPILTLIIGIFSQGCANIVPPSGGKKDESSPLLLGIFPADSSLNIKVSKITLRFNKFMEVKDLQQQLRLSPLLNTSPSVISYGKRVEIKFLDTSLLPNTTYHLSLGDALTDNRESNPYKNFSYTFSTGPYFDSLELKGNVIDAATGIPDTSVTLLLYNAEENDSVVLRKKPLYISSTNASGDFVFHALPHKAFHMYALQDLNNNLIYDQGTEKIGFTDTLIIPSLDSNKRIHFYIFKESRDTVVNLKSDSLNQDSIGFNNDKTTPSPALAGRSGAKNIRPNQRYRVNVDTINKTQRTVELNQPLTIDLFTQISTLDTEKVYLSYEDEGIEIEALQQLSVDSQVIKIKTEWKTDKTYILRLVKGWATDTTGAELPPAKYFFRTKRAEDYATLKIHIASQYHNDSFVLYLYKGADSIYQKSITDTIITVSLLQPGQYGIRIIRDTNKNSIWDTGNLLERKQPERVIPYTQTIILKAGWENDIDFKPPESSNTLPHTFEEIEQK